jgi:hypothetical protein
VSTRTISVQVFVDSEAIGSGVIEYIDDAVPSFTELYVDRCVAQKMCIDSECYDNAVGFCYRDTIAMGGGGVVETTLKVPVAVNGVVVGEATLEFVDAYAGVTLMSLLVSALTVLVLLSIIGAVVSSISKALKEKRRKE